MPTLTFELAAEMDDGTGFTVVADQRDMARFEVQPFGWPIVKIEENLSMTMLRFLGWSAATRQQLTKLPWPDFDAACIEVMPMAGDEDGESDAADDAVDPGQPAP